MRVACFGVLLCLVIARSWLCDDAYITLRTVDNLVHGWGLRWNVADRVQTYTHPLWMLLLAAGYALTREPYFTTLFSSWTVTAIGAYLIVFRLARTPSAGVWTTLALAGSVSFCDYATSGLENPLTHLLLISFVLAHATALPTLTLCSALLTLTRPDALLLCLPTLIHALWRSRHQLPWQRLLLAGSPAVAWLIFSMMYYGFPWPNTAYAKLGSGIPSSELVQQGFYYLGDSLYNDPLTLTVVAGAIVLALLRGQRAQRLLALGLLLHLAWVVRAGGDFMSGRFLTPAFVLSVALLARHQPASRILLLLTLVLGVIGPRATWRLGTSTRSAPIAHGIADERGFYLAATGLAARLYSGPNITHDARIAASALRARGRALIRLDTFGCGIFGYYAGPNIHIVDEWALTDPLLARLPALRQLHWRIGHFVRGVPSGYMKSLSSGHNQLRDAKLHRYWDELSTVVRGPLFSTTRARALLGFATGQTEQLIDREHLRLADMVITELTALDIQPPGLLFGDGGLELRFQPIVHARTLQLTLEGGDLFQLTWQDGTSLALQLSGAQPKAVTIPAASARRLRILPLRGDSAYRLARLAPGP